MTANLRNVLVSSAGRRVALVRFFQSSLHNLQLPGRVYAIDMKPTWSSASRVADRAVKSPHVLSNEYRNFLADLVDQDAIGVIIPTIDTELQVLAELVSVLKQRHCNVVVCDLPLIIVCRDKRLSDGWFQELGFETAKILDRSTLTFPCFAKPVNGSLSVGACAVLSERDLSQQMLADANLLFLEYCSPAEFDEYTVDAYYDRNGGLKCLVPRKRVEVRGGEISKGIALKGKTYTYLWDKLARIPGARGCLTYQFFVSKGEDRWVANELNPRFGGGYPLSHAAGANFPEWILREYLLGEEIPVFEDWQDRTAMVRYDSEIIFVASESP